MNSLSLLLFVVFQCTDRLLSMSHENIIKQIPLTIKTALNKFNIMAKIVTYAMCRCHCTYAPSYWAGSTILTYPEYCTHYPNPGTLCGESLLDTQPNGAPQLKKTFVYHNFNDYLASLLLRSDIESMMDRSCDDLIMSLKSPHFVKTPFEVQFLCKFSGPKAGQLFMDSVMTVTSHPSLVTSTHVYSQSRPHLNSP